MNTLFPVRRSQAASHFAASLTTCPGHTSPPPVARHVQPPRRLLVYTVVFACTDVFSTHMVQRNADVMHRVIDATLQSLVTGASAKTWKQAKCQLHSASRASGAGVFFAPRGRPFHAAAAVIPPLAAAPAAAEQGAAAIAAGVQPAGGAPAVARPRQPAPGPAAAAGCAAATSEGWQYQARTLLCRTQLWQPPRRRLQLPAQEAPQQRWLWPPLLAR